MSDRRVRLLSVAVLAAAAIVFSLACDDDAPAAPPSRPLATTIEDASLALLPLEAMPAAGAVHERLRAPGNPEPPALRATADAPRVGLNPYIAHTVDVYQPGAAGPAMATLRTIFAPGVTFGMTFPAESGGTRLMRVLFWSLPSPDLGDDSFAVWFDAADGGKGAFIAVRRGDVITMLRHYTAGLTGESVDTDRTWELAHRADEQLAQILRGR